MRYLLILPYAFLFLTCSTNDTYVNKFADSVFVKIAEYQDLRQPDSLTKFITSDNVEHRKAAVLAFASIQDTSYIDIIGAVLMKDNNPEVRAAAAFALGQTGGKKAFQVLSQSLSKDSNNPELAEALAKTIVNSTDFPANSGSWALYRLGMRGFADSTHSKLAIEFLKMNYDVNTRLGAAHFFSRGPAEISVATEALIYTIQNDSSVFVRMAAASALRKIKTKDVQKALSNIFQSENDYRVRINIIRALQSYPLKETEGVFSKAIHDTNINVAIAASEAIRPGAFPENFTWFVTHARAVSTWRVRSNLYEAALGVSSQKELSEEIVKHYGTSTNIYEKAALLTALGNSPMQYMFVKEQLLNSPYPVIRTSAITSLSSMNRHRLFEVGMKKSFLEIYKSALQLGDPAVTGIAASVLADSVLGYKSIIVDGQFLYEARKKLTLPKDNEALQQLEAAIAYYEGKKVSPVVKNEFNHPVDWALVKTIPSDQRAIIRTDKGDIEIHLLVEEAPGSVANFITLAQAKYFNTKNFHRVVPNFVIQGGCNRGDGWGSEDYSIRSEFSMRRYTEGSVGMASAGKDTEGTQWFITHSPTPHLDGRYTIFAEVVRGMEVVHQMEVGDKILSVEILQQ